MAGVSRPSMSFLPFIEQGVDARHKAGHDEEEGQPGT